MNWLDLIILVFLVSALIRGIEVGFVRQICSTSGFFIGLFIGAWVESHLIGHIETPDSRAVFALLVTLGCAVLLMLVGEVVGLRLKFRLSQVMVTDKIDRVLGSGLAAVTLLVGVWLGASVFRNMPVDFVQREIRSSRVVAILNNRLPSAPSLITKLGHLIDPNGFPQVFTGLERSVQSNAPLPDIGALNSAVQKDHVSIVKVEGEGCGGVVQGSGFVAANNSVITNAHVVAGVRQPLILDSNGDHASKVVWFDPNLDLAILRAKELAGPPLPLDTKLAASGTAAAIVGYPGGGSFTANPAAVLEAFTAIGRNIYNHSNTERRVYSLKATIEQGNSGGPVITKDGSVIGILFAKSTSYDQVGYALTADQVTAPLAQAQQATTAVSTGDCAE